MTYALVQARKAAPAPGGQTLPASRGQIRRDFIGALIQLVETVDKQAAGRSLHTMFRSAEDGVAVQAKSLGYGKPFGIFTEKRGRTKIFGVKLFLIRGGEPMQVTLGYVDGITPRMLSQRQRALITKMLRTWITQAEEDARKDAPSAGPTPTPASQPTPNP